MNRKFVGLALLLTMACAGDVAAQAVPADFSVTLERTICFGTCPAYSVTIDARGNVTYQGFQFVRVEGKQTATVPVSRVADLAAAVDRIAFFDLAAAYRANVTDNPTTFVTVTKNSRRKRIEDYVAGPRALREFQRLIDEVAGTRKWVRIDGPTLQAMFASGKPPSRAEESELLSNAIAHDDVDVLQVLLAHGLDPNRTLHDVPLIHLARSPESIKVLKQAGADVTARTDRGNALEAAGEYGPEFTKALLDAGVPADVPSSNGWTPLLSAACRGNVEVTALLLAAGADPERRANGTTALECAQKEARYVRPDFPGLSYLYKKDYAATIRLLETEIAKRKRR